MICNKKAYADLRKDCETCSERDACFSGHAVGVALAQPILQDVAQPLLVPHDYRNIKVAEGMTLTVDVEDLKKQLERDLYRKAGLGLQFGA